MHGLLVTIHTCDEMFDILFFCWFTTQVTYFDFSFGWYTTQVPDSFIVMSYMLYPS
jgi:hypothetical protein